MPTVMEDLGEVTLSDATHREWGWSDQEQTEVVKFRAPDLMACFDVLEDLSGASDKAPPGNTFAHWRAVLPSFIRAIRATSTDEGLKGLNEQEILTYLQDRYTFVDIIYMGTLVLKKLHQQVGFSVVSKEDRQTQAPFTRAPIE